MIKSNCLSLTYQFICLQSRHNKEPKLNLRYHNTKYKIIMQNIKHKGYLFPYYRDLPDYSVELD